MKRTFAYLFVFLLLFSCAVPSHAASKGVLGGFWAQVDGDDTGKSDGLGAKMIFPRRDGSGMTLKWSKFDDFDGVDYDLEISPVDLGIHMPLSKDKTALYVAGSLTWFLIDATDTDGTDLNADDVWGWSASIGAQVELTDALQFFAEVLYRGTETNADLDNLDELVDGDKDTASLEIDGIAYEIGLLLRW